MAGRETTASSVVKILESIVENNSDDPQIKHITLWIDSCVPQNRNSLFSNAVSVYETPSRSSVYYAQVL